ncbi:MAG: putative PEP-binding protein [Sedimenticola sp.]
MSAPGFQWLFHSFNDNQYERLCAPLKWPHYGTNTNNIEWIDGFVLEIIADNHVENVLEATEFARELDLRLGDLARSDVPTDALVVDWQHDLAHTGERRPIRLSPISMGDLTAGNIKTIENAHSFLHELGDIFPSHSSQLSEQLEQCLRSGTSLTAAIQSDFDASYGSSVHKSFPTTCADQLLLVVHACLVRDHKSDCERRREFSFRVRPDLLYSTSDEVRVGLIYPPFYGDDEEPVSFVSSSCSLDDLHAGVSRPSDLEVDTSGILSTALATLSAWYKDEPIVADVVSLVVYRNKARLYDMWPGPMNAHTSIRRAAHCVRTAKTDLASAAISALTHDMVQKITLRSLEDLDQLQFLAAGVTGAPGAVSGIACLNLVDVEEAHHRNMQAVLFGEDPTPDLLPAVLAADGLVFKRGGATSHVAVIARGSSKAAVFGVGEIVIDYQAQSIQVGRQTLTTNSRVSIDGLTARLYEGYSKITNRNSTHEDDLKVVLDWCDHQATIKVYANADTMTEVRSALVAGAKGVGLCRLEHLLGRPEYLPHLQSAIALSWLLRDCSQKLWAAKAQSRAWPRSKAAVARLLLEEASLASQDTGESLRYALSSIRDGLAVELEKIFIAVSGRPVVVRLLDPPISEFLDLHRGEQIASMFGKTIKSDVHQLLRTQNPMLGLRGVRLGLLFPELTRAQVVATCRAAIQAGIAIGTRPNVSVLLPMIADASEVDEMREIIDGAVVDAGLSGGLSLTIGAMIETPRAALLAGSIAERSDFISIGTNDLTQFTWACSRDSADTDFLNQMPYVGMFSPPFQHIDDAGVGRLIRSAIHEARLVRPDIEIGICGEQIGDLSSLQFFANAGATYVSCATPRLRAARLLAAQATMKDREMVAAPENCERKPL